MMYYELKTRKEKVNYILDYGNDATQTKYTIEDLAYRSSDDLTFIIIKIRGNIINK